MNSHKTIMTNIIQTSIINEDIAIKAVSEENYVLLVFEIQICSCKEMWEKAANNKNILISTWEHSLFVRSPHFCLHRPSIAREKLQVVHFWKRLKLLHQFLFS